jgi:hypothetical protein
MSELVRLQNDLAEARAVIARIEASFMQAAEKRYAKPESDRDEADTEGGRHLAMLLTQRAKTRAIAEAADTWLRQRDEARREAERYAEGRRLPWQLPLTDADDLR